MKKILKKRFCSVKVILWNSNQYRDSCWYITRKRNATYQYDDYIVCYPSVMRFKNLIDTFEQTMYTKDNASA